MNRSFDRVRFEPAPDLWPEIERRIDQPRPPAGPRRARTSIAVAVCVALVGGGLVWALSALRLGSRHTAGPSPRIGAVHIPAGSSPQPIAAGAGAVWVVSGASENGNVLWRIDPATNRATELPGTRGAEWPGVGEGFAWVTCSGQRNPCGGNSVLKLDPASGRTLATIPVPGFPDGVTAGLGYAWASTDAGLVKIDPRTATVVASFPVDTTQAGTAGGFVWGMNLNENVVLQIDPSDGRVVKRIPFDDPCMFLPTDEGVWVSSCNAGVLGTPPDTLMRIDPSTGDVSYRLALGGPGEELSLAGGRLWLAGWLGNHVELQARDPGTGQPTGQVVSVFPKGSPWVTIGIGPPSVPTGVSSGSFWLTHVDSHYVVRVPIPRG